MRFIEYRQPPHEMQRTQVEVTDRTALIAHCKKQLAQWPSLDHLRDSDFVIAEYDPEWTDPPLGAAREWITHVVFITGYGVVGFTDSPCPQSEAASHE